MSPDPGRLRCSAMAAAGLAPELLTKTGCRKLSFTSFKAEVAQYFSKEEDKTELLVDEMMEFKIM